MSEDASVADPYSTAHLRKLLDPVMRRNEKHTGMQRNSAEEAFLDSLIKDGIVPLLPELEAFAGPYQEAERVRLERAAAEYRGEATPGTTSSSALTPGDPDAASPPPMRAVELAALPAEMFMERVHSLPLDELDRIAVPPDDDVDVFDDEQRHVIGEVLAGKRSSDVFEIDCTDPMPKPGEAVEYDGKLVVMLGLSEEPDRMRVAYVDGPAK